MSLRRGLMLAVGVALVVLVVTLLARPAQPTPLELQILADSPTGVYNPARTYVGPTRSNLAPPRIILGHEHVPVVQYPGLGYQQNPVTVAQYGLRAFSRYVLHHRESDKAEALTAAGWLLTHQRSDGRWLYMFPFHTIGATVTPPWPSALAQGQAMSLLERVYRVTRQHRYLTAALKALRPLYRPVARGGLRTCFDNNCHLPFFQEYVAAKPVDVLNGFMYTLIGLYDLSSVAPHSAARRIYRAGRRTLVAALPKYNSHGLARYDLASPQLADQEYQAVHIYLLRALNSLAPSREFAFYASLWRRNLLRAPS